MDRPNILLVMTDQQRGDCLGCDGHPVVETPNLDELAAEGVRFTSAYSATPSCIPARATLMTGQNQWHAGILGMGQGQKRMRADYPHTLPGELAAAGYHTQLVGKMHFHPPRALNGYHNTILDEHESPNRPDFKSDYQIWFEANRPGEVAMREHGVDWNSMLGRPYHLPEFLHPTNWTVRESVKFLQRRDDTRPFFLTTSFIRPHSPYDPPQFFWDMYNNRDLPKPFQSEWSAMHDRPEDAVRTTAWRGKRSDLEVHRARAGYYGCVTHVDYQIGVLLDYMKRFGLMKNTLVIFTSDHGDMLGDHNLWRKTYAYESSARIPLIVRFPETVNVPKARVCDRVVELRDLMPTILDVAGVGIPETVDGDSLLKLARGETEDWREYLHGEHSTCYSEEQEHQYVTDGKRKYIWFPRLGTEQFFDLARDPAESTDLSGDPLHQEEMALWRNRLIAELEPRKLGLVKEGKLVRQKGPIVSPYRDQVRVV